jgi:hypothetical protein
MKAVYQETQARHDRYSHLSEAGRLVLSYSFIVAAVYAIVFLIAKISGLEDRIELRFINYILLFPIAYSALNKVYLSNNRKMEYFSGFAVSMLIAALGSFWYSIMFYIYLKIDQSFHDYLI